jgi:YcaO-like protein with predicted kinase domain
MIAPQAIERFQRLGPPPAETLLQLMGWRETMGISRVGDITGLDRLGIPVMQAVRPFSLSNAVSQGKGGDPTIAAISSLLESAEACFAERVDNFQVEVASARALQIPGDRYEKHLLEGAPHDWRNRDIPWVEAIDLHTGARQPVPFELVHTAYLTPPLPQHGLFAASTTGLAAGLAEDDAVAHGILECIERDAIARAHRVHGFFQRHRIDPATIDDPAVCDLLDHLASRGILVGLWHAPSVNGIPVVWCHLMESAESDSALLRFPADGSAASIDPASAIVHAIQEAAQSRLAAISGARDDITRASYPKFPDRALLQAHRRLLVSGPRPIHFDTLCGNDEAGNAGVREALLSTLLQHGSSSVLLVSIHTTPLTALSVVRIIIPQLEPLLAN